MAAVHGVIRYALALLLVGFVGPVFALKDTTPAVWKFTGYNPNYTSAAEACAAGGTQVSYTVTSVEAPLGAWAQRTGNCLGRPISNPAYPIGTWGTVQEVCPVTWSAATAVATCEKIVTECPPPKVPNAQGVCELPPPPSCGTPGVAMGTGSTTWYTDRQAGAGSLNFCHQGCAYTASLAGQDSSGTYFGGPAESTGVNCSDGQSSPGVIPSQVPPGKCPGTVNGTTVYVACDRTWAAPTNEGGTNTGGSGNSTTSATTQTTCTAVTCTTTTTTTTTQTSGTGAGGQACTTAAPCTSTGTSTKDTPASEYCKANPGDKQCSGDEDDESSWGGSCAAAFACDGDAIQCAMAKEQHVRNCAIFDTPTTLSGIGEAAATGTNPSDHPKNAAESVAIELATALSAVPLFGATGQCPQDVPFQVMGQSFALPFSTLCPYLQLLGAAFLACCYMTAGFIVFRRS